MNILALDPSSKAIGWAVADRAGTRSGLFHPLDTRARARERDARHRHMCGRAGEWLADMITDHEPSITVIETGGGRSDACSERLRGALFLVTYTRDVLTQTVHPHTWQAWARRNLPARLEKWLEDERPDDVAAELILEWWIATQAHRVECAA